jgi:hypothetical protein
MRILYWLLGAAAASAGAAYVVNRGRQGRIAQEFLEALRQGPIKIHADEPSIIAAGLRAEVFRGEIAGRPFSFVARVDATGTRWTFALVWSDAGSFIQSMVGLPGESDHPLQAAYQILRRHTSESNGVSN